TPTDRIRASTGSHQASLPTVQTGTKTRTESTYKRGQSGVQVTNIELPTSWNDFANWADVNLAGRVTLTPNARRQVKSPEFEDYGLVARCLLWLANDGRERRTKGGQGSIREEVIEEGVRNAHCGKDEFEFDWQGKPYTADWHIKNGGNTRDPGRCLRIYYAWDEQTQQMIVAHLPAHRRTDAS
ncbi:MAG: hypothetical protein AB7F72_11390, partial [Afipia sp.]